MAGMMKRALVARVMACGVCMTALAPVQATATVYDFFWTDSGGYTETFQFDDSLPPAFADSTHFIYNRPGGPVEFYDTVFTQTSYGGPYNFIPYVGGSYYFYTGQQLYSGSPTAPSFTPGFYNLVGSRTYGGMSGATGTLRISQAGAPGGAAPEVGLGLLSLLAAVAALGFTRLWKPLTRRATR